MMNEALRLLLPVLSDVADRTALELIRNAAPESSIERVLQNGKGEAFEMQLPSASTFHFTLPMNTEMNSASS